MLYKKYFKLKRFQSNLHFIESIILTHLSFVVIAYTHHWPFVSEYLVDFYFRFRSQNSLKAVGCKQIYTNFWFQANHNAF